MPALSRRPHAIMAEQHFNHVQLSDAFWNAKLDILANVGIEVQRQRLEETHCINNFRLVGGTNPHLFRVGFFYSDSDVYKWLEGACRILQLRPNAELAQNVDEIIIAIQSAQQADGYLYTYDIAHFPGRRWQYMQVMHQLYCAGHLIEAAIARSEQGKDDLLGVAIKLADLIVRDFADKGPEGTDGHEEIAVALIRLYRHTGKKAYLELAEHLVNQRGRMPRPGLSLIKDFRGWIKSEKAVARQRAEFEARENKRVESIAYTDPFLSHNNLQTMLKAVGTFLSGRYHQQHIPARDQREVVGHAVRQTYYAAEMGDMYLETGDAGLRQALEAMWENMVARRMYVTGGVGSRGITEAFGRDYELPNRTSYSETCATIGTMLWAWRMTLATGDAQYAEIFERQLYNAFLVGMAVDGRTWMYHNPLESVNGMARDPWFKTPCCPPNIARTLPSLGGYIYGTAPDAVWIHQYIGNKTALLLQQNCHVEVQVDSELPWGGTIRIRVNPQQLLVFSMHIRIPAWTPEVYIELNGEEISLPEGKLPRYFSIERKWAQGDVIRLSFEVAPHFVASHPKVKENRGKLTIMRGPLVYCLEGIDNQDIDLFHTTVRRDQELRDEHRPDLVGGVWVVKGRTYDGAEFTAIPFFAWANRAISPMRVWMPAE